MKRDIIKIEKIDYPLFARYKNTDGSLFDDEVKYLIWIRETNKDVPGWDYIKSYPFTEFDFTEGVGLDLASDDLDSNCVGLYFKKLEDESLQ